MSIRCGDGVLVGHDTLNSVTAGTYVADVGRRDGWDDNLHITNNALNGAWLDTTAADQASLVISNNH